jgi:uncharacterized protein YbaP (TraB family)
MTIHKSFKMYRGKKMRLLQYFIVVILSFLFAANPLADNARDTEPGKHFLWSVRSEKSTVYILGSIHILREDAYPLPEEIERVYSCCSMVVFETDLDGMSDIESQNRMMKLGMYQHGQGLSKNITPETYRLLEKRMTAAGLPIKSFEQFKPWFVSLSLAGAEIKRLGYDPGLGIDRYFFNKAKKDKREMFFLESNQYQLDLMAAMDRRQQESFLRETLKEIDLIEMMASDMVNAWMNGDAEKLYSVTKAGFEEHPDIYYRFFVQRNKKWLPVIENLAQQGKDVLVIVGAGHLVGEENLIDLLRNKGYEVGQR